MGRYSSIRGWIQLNDDMMPQVEKIIDHFSHEYSAYDLSDETAEIYQGGWIRQQKIINWSKYIFFGADIQSKSNNFIKDQVKEIATSVYVEDPPFKDFPKGYFVINDEDEDFALIWQFEDGTFEEKIEKGLFIK